MANKKITELDAITTLASTDVVPVVDVSADTTNKITTTNLFRTLPDGTAAAPSLSFASDAANGIYLASSDTVGISTGGTQRVTVDGSGNVTISGDLTVSGATTTVESTTVTIDDKNIELGSVASPSNTTADGGGITLKGATDKTIKWINSTGFWTFNTGVEIDGNLQMDDGKKIRLGTGQDLQIYHDGSNSYIDDAGTGVLNIRSNDLRLGKYTGELGLQIIADGETRLHYDNSVKLATKTGGIDVTGEVQCDSLDVDGAVDIDGGQIYYDAANNNLHFIDNVKARFGTGSDLRIYHDGNNSFIDEAGTGQLFIRAHDRTNIQKYTGETCAQFIADGAVNLYHDGTIKFSTKSDGIDVAGEVQCDSLDVDGTADFTGDATFRGGAAAVEIAANSDIRLISGSWTGDYGAKIQHHSNTLYIQGGSSGIIFRDPDGTDRARFDANGHFHPNGSNNYDLGTSSNQWRNGFFDGTVNADGLDVDGNADISGDISISGGNKTVQTTAGFLQVGTSGSNHLAFITNGSERGRVDSSGRLMLGTTTEGDTTADNLTIADSGNCGMTVRSGTSSSGSIFFSDATSGSGEYDGYVQYQHDNQALRFATAATERLRINSNGAWGIEGASNYGTSGQVLTSNGNDSPTWQDAGAASVGGASAISMNDNVKINFGASNDLQIYHDGTNSYIDDAGTGNLRLNGNEVHILSNDNSEYSGRFISNGAVELYYDNSRKFATKTWGVDITGELQCDSLDVDGNVNFAGDYHYFSTSSSSNASLTLKKTAGSADSIDYLQCRSNSNALKAKIGGNGEVECLSLDVNGAADITGTVTLHGNLDMQDNDQLLIGSGDDLRLYHDGSNSFIDDNGTGNLVIRANTLAIEQQPGSGEVLGKFIANGAVELYYDNSKKLETRGAGVQINGDLGIGGVSPGNSFDNGAALALGDNDTGIRQNGDGILEVWSNNAQMFRFRNGGDSNQSYNHLNPSANNSKDLGTSSLRWRNVYTNDLNLSNEGSANEVDGTWGSYTIQEGEDDLFLINRRNGKKYKFNLTEVS